MIEYYLLEQLVAFSEEESLSKAAEKLHISQPALSRSMKKIENIIGVPLFNRTSNKIELNDAGKTAVKYAKKALKSNQVIIENVRATAQMPQHIRLGICNKFIPGRFKPLLNNCYPGAHITYDHQDDAHLYMNLKNEKDDLVVMHTKPSDDPNLYVQHCFDEQLMLTILKSDSLAQKKELHFSDLNGMSILAARGADFWLDIFREHIANLSLLIQDSMEILDTLVKESKFSVFNTSICIKDYPDPENKISIPIVDPPGTVSHYLVCRREDKTKFEKIFSEIRANKKDRTF